MPPNFYIVIFVKSGGDNINIKHWLYGAAIALLLICLVSLSFVQMTNYRLIQEGARKNAELNGQISNLKKQISDVEQHSKRFTNEKSALQNTIDDLNRTKIVLEDRLGYSDKIAIERYASPMSNEKIAYLTFDDGPSENTKAILSILKRYNVKATFFVLGGETKFTSNMYKLIIKDGHAIGNHTYSHEYGQIYAKVGNFLDDFYKLQTLLLKQIGYEPKIMRFPGGSDNHVSWRAGGRYIMAKIQQEMIRRGFVYFDWNVDSTDASKVVQSKSEIVRNVLSQAKYEKNAIVLMHDAKIKTTTVQALPEIIQGLKDQGFRFATLNEKSFVVQFQRPNEK